MSKIKTTDPNFKLTRENFLQAMEETEKALNKNRMSGKEYLKKMEAYKNEILLNLTPKANS